MVAGGSKYFLKSGPQRLGPAVCWSSHPFSFQFEPHSLHLKTGLSRTEVQPATDGALSNVPVSLGMSLAFLATDVPTSSRLPPTPREETLMQVTLGLFSGVL